MVKPGNIMSTLSLILLLSSPCLSIYNICGDRPFIACIAQLESEILRCYDVYNKADVYDWSGDEITKVPDPKFFSTNNARLFNLTIEALRKIAEVLGKLEVGKDDDKITAKAKELFKVANYSYHFAKKADKNANPYHNLCHGLYNMTMSSILFYQMHGTCVDSKSNKCDMNHATIMFSGLFSDALHPGVGNKLYGAKNDIKNLLYSDVSKAIKAFTGKGTHGTFINDLKAATNEALETIESGKDDNKQGGFNWEMVQMEFAKGVVKGLFKDNKEIDEDYIKFSISLTYDGSKDYWANSMFFELIQTGILTKKDVNEDFDKTFANKMAELKDGKHRPLSSLVLFANISRFAAATKEFLILSAKQFLQEQHEEVKKLKKGAVDKIDESEEYKRVCKDVDYDKIYNALDTYLKTTLVNILKKKILPTTDNLVGFKGGVTELKKTYKEIEDSDFNTSYKSVVAKIEQIDDGFNKVYNANATKPEDFPLLKQFMDAFEVNRKFLEKALLAPTDKKGDPL